MSREKQAYLASTLTRENLVDTNATYGKLASILSKALKVEGDTATAAALNALTNPMPGLLTTITTGGTLTLGSLVVVTNDTVYFNGLIWVKAQWVQNVAPTAAFTADTTMTAAMSGMLFLIGADAKTATLPSSATVGAGIRYAFLNAGADGSYGFTINPNASDKIMGSFSNGKVKVTMTGTDNKDLVNTKATALRGDYMVVESDGADGWYILDGVGIWTEESQVANNESPKTVETLTVAKTVTIADTGKLFILAAAAGAELTLPAVATSAGFNARVMVGLAFANTAWTIKAASNVIQGGAIVNSTFVGSANQNLITFAHAAETVGDFIDLNCDGTNWYATGVAAAAGGITFTAP